MQPYFFQNGKTNINKPPTRLNPNEDLQQAAAAWCLLRQGGLLIAPPMASEDMLRWPLGRVYGPKRWPHLVANFELLRTYDGVATVLRKP